MGARFRSPLQVSQRAAGSRLELRSEYAQKILGDPAGAPLVVHAPTLLVRESLDGSNVGEARPRVKGELAVVVVKFDRRCDRVAVPLGR